MLNGGILKALSIYVYHQPLWLGGWVVRDTDLRSTGRGFESRPPRCRVQPWASCLHTRASVTKQYNLVPANGRWCSVAVKVTAGLAESTGSLPPGLWLRSPAGWLLRISSTDQLRNPTLISSIFYLYLIPYLTFAYGLKTKVSSWHSVGDVSDLTIDRTVCKLHAIWTVGGCFCNSDWLIDWIMWIGNDWIT